MSKPIWMWGIFFATIVFLLLANLGFFSKKNKEMSIKESLYMSFFYIFVACAFGLSIWYSLGFQSFAEYMTGFLVEKSLSLDNIFLISLIFSSFSIPLRYQHRVLFLGILGAIFLRGIMIAIGTHLIENFSWILYLFAIFMIVTGVKMFFIDHKAVDIRENRMLLWMQKHLNITDSLHDQKFTVQLKNKAGNIKTYITPLFVALILIEFTDLIFAVDSVPAIFTITKDPYIVYTSNIFAILGLRAIYLALATIIQRFYYLKFALAAVLVFIGSKIFIAYFIGMEKFPPTISLSVTFGLLSFGCLYSIYKSRSYAHN